MQKYIHYCWFGGKPLPKLANKCLKSWKKYLPDWEIILWNESNSNIKECPFVKEAYESKKWAFVADYVRTKALKEYGGIYFDTDMEVTSNIDHLFNDETDTFLGIEDSGFVAVGAWFERNKNSYLTTELLKTYQSYDHFPLERMSEIAIPKLISKLLVPSGLEYSKSYIQKLEKNIVIYPREYFYPYSYDWKNNVFTNNTCMIHYYDASWIPLRQKLDILFVRKFGKKHGIKILNFLRFIKRNTKRVVKFILFPVVLVRRAKRKIDGYIREKNNLNESINKLEGKKSITFYNKNWMGTASSTLELFENNVPLIEIYYKKNIKRLRKTITKLGIDDITFSAFAVGWKDLAIRLKKDNPKMTIRVFWHGSLSQVLEYYGYERNKEIIELNRSGIIDKIGVCKKSLLNFYKKNNINAYFVTNTVDIKNNVTYDFKSKNCNEIKVGIYAARCSDWRKNVYSQIAAMSNIDNAVLDIIPLDSEIKKVLALFNINYTGVGNSLSREELIKRMSQNDVNLYVTYSECAPMLPLESFEVGVPCVCANNNHYFENSKLMDMIVVNNETSISEIESRILFAVKNKNKIMQEYYKFKKININNRDKQLKEFLGK